MSQSRIPSPARSQGAVTPRRYNSRRAQSVGSPARSTASGRLSSLIRVKETDKNSFVLSPAPTRRSVLNDDTYIEEPRRRSWWKKLSDNSRDVMEALKDNKILETNEAVEEFIDIEVLSQEKKNYTMDLPESSDGESVSSIVIPQRKLFTQKDMQAQDRFGQLMGPRETLTKLQKSVAHEKTINVAPKNLFNQPSKPRARPMFPAALLNISPNKTANKTKEITITEKAPTRNLFGNNQASKRKNMFEDFIMSDSEDEISEIQPKIFGFARNADQQQNANLQQRDPSPTSSITADIEMDEWKMLPSSTMVENQLEDILEPKQPVEKTRLSRLSELPDNNKVANKSIDRTKSKQMRKSEVNNSKTLVEPQTNLEKSVTNTNMSKLLATEGENTKSLRKSRSDKSRLEGSLSGTKDSNTEHETSAKRPRLSTSPTQSEDVRNKSLNQSNRTVIENSIMTRSRRSNLSKTLNTSNSETHTHKIPDKTKRQSPEPEPINKESSSEDDVLNMSLVYDEQDEIDAIKSSQDEVDVKGQDISKKGVANKSKDHVKDSEEVVHSDKVLRSRDPVNQLQTTDKEMNDAEPKSDNINHDNNEINNKLQDNSNKSVQNTNVGEHGLKERDIEEKETAEVPAEPEKTKEKLETNDGKLEIEGEKQSIENKKENEEINKRVEQQIDEDNKVEEDDQEIAEENEDEQEVEVQNHEVDEVENEKENNMEIQIEEKADDQEIDAKNDDEEQEVDEENVDQEEDQEINEEYKDQEEDQEIGEENDDQEIDEEAQEEEQEVEEESQEAEQSDQEEEDIEQSQEEAEVNESQEEPEMDQSEEEAEINESQEEPEMDQNQEEEEINVSQEEPEMDQSEEESEINESQEEAEVSEEEQEIEVADVQDDGEDMQDASHLDESNREIDDDDNEENIEANESTEEIQNTNEGNQEEATNVSHDTTGRHRKKNESKLNSPEVILHDKTKQMESFTAKGRNTSLRRTSIMKNMNIRPSLAPPRESTGFSDGKDSSGEGSGWDSHRTTRKTLRQTFGKDFTPRKSLRALVMEKSAKQTGVNETAMTSKYPQANSTELPETTNVNDDSDVNVSEANHDVSKRTRQTTLEMYLQKIKKQNMEKRLQIEENVKNSLKAPMKDISNMFKVPSKPMFSSKKSNFKPQKPKAKQIKSNLIPLDDLPAEVIEDMKYKPPKRYQPSNASWITKRLYKFLEAKLEPKYDYKARVRAEKLVGEIYQFAKELRRHPVASAAAVDGLKLEMARLDIVTTHFDFYQFFHDYMPREIRVKVIPDVMNKLPMPRHGVFTEILRNNTVQG